MKKLKAITLIEVLVYLAVFGIVFIGILQFVFAIGSNNKSAVLRKEIQRAETFISEHLSDSFSKINGIDAANTVYNLNNGKIRLNKTGGYIEYSISSNALSFNNNGTSLPISSPEYIINQFYIEKIISSSNTITGARITLKITSAKSSTISDTFTTAYTFK